MQTPLVELEWMNSSKPPVAARRPVQRHNSQYEAKSENLDIIRQVSPSRTDILACTSNSATGSARQRMPHFAHSTLSTPHARATSCGRYTAEMN